ncbi:MAG: Ubiquitin-conjugating enzyme E2 6 [Watsoniomyces obsoletus]|nr:MAG: Ubiquitin-conjugating enzyme E2 6 [Watsoniomyces obsoletus]
MLQTKECVYFPLYIARGLEFWKLTSGQLAREYKVIQENPPEYIVAHPSERNILEWHYVITGPPQTPYHGGQYWGTLVFTPNYPYAPPAIRMHTPSGRFQPSTRLCLSISDFHPKSFNPAWGISTILIGLLSFMTSDEMTTGSISATDQERRWLASRSRWWNSTGGGSGNRGSGGGANPSARIVGIGAGAIRSGDGGARFQSEWPELHQQNLKWMTDYRINIDTGDVVPKSLPAPSSSGSTSCAPAETAALRRLAAQPLSNAAGNAANQAAGVGADGRSWIRRNKYLVGLVVVFSYVLVVRVLNSELVAS